MNRLKTVAVGNVVGLMGSRGVPQCKCEVVRLTKTQCVVKYPNGNEGKFRLTDFARVGADRWYSDWLTTEAYYDQMVSERDNRIAVANAWNKLKGAANSQRIELARAAMLELEALLK